MCVVSIRSAKLHISANLCEISEVRAPVSIIDFPVIPLIVTGIDSFFLGLIFISFLKTRILFRKNGLTIVEQKTLASVGPCCKPFGSKMKATVDAKNNCLSNSIYVEYFYGEKLKGKEEFPK